MTILQTYVRRGRHLLTRWLQPLREKGILAAMLWGLGGCFLSAASLGNEMQPLCLAVLCAGVPGWLPLAFAGGAALGYRIFWAGECLQALLWLAGGLPVCMLFSQTGLRRARPMLQPALGGLIVAVSGVIFQMWQGDQTPILLYFLRIALTFGATWLCLWYRDRRDPAAEWALLGLGVLALAQIAPLPWLGLGFLAGAMTVAAMPFPAVAMAGLALDLAGVTPVPMTAVLCLSYLVRLLPRTGRTWLAMAPGTVYCLVMGLCGQLDLQPVLPLLLGGGLGVLLPLRKAGTVHRRGETGFAQVRLELAAEVMAQMEHLLLESGQSVIDAQALVQKAAQQACGGCPCRKSCREAEVADSLPAALLHQPLESVDAVPVSCKKRGRLLQELRHSQESYRRLLAERESRQLCRDALLQQYRFLSEYLQELADRLPQRGGGKQKYRPEVAVSASGREKVNGDRCLWFAGTECRYYLLLCDGMGTGAEAAAEAGAVSDMLRRLLLAGYPAPYALRTVNSLCALRDQAATVTVDLAELCLDSGKVTVFKWGAAPSWLVLPAGVERIGSVSVPPGLSPQGRETVEHLTMRRGEALVLASDGIDPGAAQQALEGGSREGAGVLAEKLLASREGEDDATAAVIRLHPI